MLLNKDEKQCILRQLCDMFSEIPTEEIKRICEERSWTVEDCIDLLIGAGRKDEVSHTSSDSSLSSPRRQRGAIPKVQNGSTRPINSTSSYENCSKKLNNPRSYVFSTEEQRVIKRIVSGARIMIIMRGAPGSGKSHLANALLEYSVCLTDRYTTKEFLLSTDDFFYDVYGNYRYNVGRLEEAHDFNQNRAKVKAADGWSPIIIDNTNMKLWEMLPYVRIALRYGYAVELLEPRTPWRFSAGKMAMRNKHKVPRDRIQLMLDKYEKGSPADLVKMVNGSSYFMVSPQMRLHPPLAVYQKEDEEERLKKFHINNGESAIDSEFSKSGQDSLQISTPKPQRSTNVQEKCTVQSDAFKNETKAEFNKQTLHEPKDQDKNVSQLNQTSKEKNQLVQKGNVGLDVKKSLLNLLRDDSAGNEQDTGTTSSQKPTFHRHTVNCSKENKSFVCLRQIYPNKELTSLWDLFVKCDGDVDWAVDILLKEDDLSLNRNYDFNLIDQIDDTFVCLCNTSIEKNPSPPPLASAPTRAVRPQHSRLAATIAKQNASIELEEMIKERVIISDDYYSKRIRKIRDSVSKYKYTGSNMQADVQIQTDPLEDEQEHVESELMEVSLNENLVQQLMDAFKEEVGSLNQKLPEQPTKKVFMPKSLAKELYMLWMESVYNQLEEERQDILREDEQFARLLKYPKYQNCKESPPNAQELLDMEMAWIIHNSDEENQKTQLVAKHPVNIAMHLTQMRLCEMFPDISRELILEILAAHGNQFSETVQTLRQTTGSSDTSSSEPTTSTQLFDRVLQQTLNSQTECERLKQEAEGYNILHDIDISGNSLLQPDEAKRLALEEFEFARNLAAHYCQLKAECHQKAGEAIRSNNGAVAMYYSQIANMHKSKIDMLNQRAANSIVNVHKYTLNNPDLLDLHYLHVTEAIECLDLFVDRHITYLRTIMRSYKYVFIITGRGLHSTSGVSSIKNRVKNRLKDRGLRWSEVNPGLLKVKIFSASKHIKQT